MANNKVSGKLRSHSLAVALACRILSQRVGYQDVEQAFLTGLLHDIGEMILFHGDQQGFERLLLQAQESKRPLVEMEKETYAFDHAFIGLTLLDSWSIDSEIGKAVLKHHESGGDAASEGLAGMLEMADYLSFWADLGFFPSLPLRRRRRWAHSAATMRSISRRPCKRCARHSTPKMRCSKPGKIEWVCSTLANFLHPNLPRVGHIV